jgi:hypothetical protein
MGALVVLAIYGFSFFYMKRRSGLTNR